MAEHEALAQVLAEASNLKASGVTLADASEVRPQVTPGMAPGDATRIATQNMAANDDAPTRSEATTSLQDELKQFASSPQGQALAGVKEKPMDEGPTRDASTQALMAELKQFASPQQQPDALRQTQQQDNQPKR